MPRYVLKSDLKKEEKNTEEPLTIKELEEGLKDPKWRINNLYRIKNKEGKEVVFKLNSRQQVLDNDPHPLKVIPKARQHGITTYKCIKGLDRALFESGYNGDVIFDNLDTAKKNFKSKIQFAWDRLPEVIRRQYVIHEFNKTTFSIGLISDPHDKRTVSVAVSIRGTTSQDLHISELGKIGAKYPEKEEEINSGALETVAAGQCITVESTAMGKRGLFWNLVQQGLENQDKEQLSPLDWKLFFFAWWEEPAYFDSIPIEIPEHLIEYFEELEKMNIHLSDGQKYWYVRKERTKGWMMKREYPSFLLEAFEGQTEGSVYLNEVGNMIKDKRYCSLKIIPDLPVYTIWDIGWGDTMVLLFVQASIGDSGKMINIVDYYENNRQRFAHYVKIIQDKPYLYGGHFLPHDGSKHSLDSGDTAKETLEKLGLRNVSIVERDPSLTMSLQEVRNIFHLLRINKDKASLFYDRLNGYRYAWNDKMNEYSKDPIHDVNSHGADTLRAIPKIFSQINTTLPLPISMNTDFGGVKPLHGGLG